jgi:hypothetical protein
MLKLAAGLAMVIALAAIHWALGLMVIVAALFAAAVDPKEGDGALLLLGLPLAMVLLLAIPICLITVGLLFLVRLLGAW